MNKSIALILVFSFFLITSSIAISVKTGEMVHAPGTFQPDSLLDAQILYNGRVWRNLNYLVIGDPYLLSNAFLTGSLTISGRTFTPLRMKYNLFEDEIHVPAPGGEIIQVNREMIDSFSLSFDGRIYRFLSIPVDSVEGLKGYVRVLYSGKAALYVKYVKKIKRSDFESRPDKYYQVTRIYGVKDKQSYLIAGKSDLLKFSGDRKDRVKDFMRKNRLHVSKKDPASFVPVFRYMDTIN
jgi:hypothetical protein